MSTSAHRRRPSPAAILLVPLALALVLTLFAWPAAKLGPRDLPVAVAGPPAAADVVERQLLAQEGAFDVRRMSDERAARAAIADREVYGAFVAAPSGPLVLTATAASPAVAQLLTHAAAQEGARVVDVAAAPHGPALASAVLPLVLGGILCGVAASLLGGSAAGRIGLLVAGSALGGLVAALIARDWLDVVGGGYAADAAAFALTILAIAAPIAGLHAWLGEKGVALGALLMVLIGNPFSGVGSAPELLPQPAGLIGQLLPPGAGGNLVRSTGYFDGAAAGGHLAVLAAWAAAGLGLVALAAARRARQPSSPRRKASPSTAMSS